MSTPPPCTILETRHPHLRNVHDFRVETTAFVAVPVVRPANTELLRRSDVVVADALFAALHGERGRSCTRLSVNVSVYSCAR